MFAQGEVYIREVKQADPLATEAVEKAGDAYIISHSESGHDHVLPCGDADVMERVKDVPEGMRIIQAIVKNPTKLQQTAQVGHKEIALPPGIYEMRIAREFNPFAEEARRVAD